MKKALLSIVGILVLLIVIFLFQSAPIDPAAYTPPKAPDSTGILIPNNLLQKAELLVQGEINGPEGVVLDRQGRIYDGTQGGKIMRLLPDGKLEVFVEMRRLPNCTPLPFSKPRCPNCPRSFGQNRSPMTLSWPWMRMQRSPRAFMTRRETT
jgi:hypothetical protein